MARLSTSDDLMAYSTIANVIEDRYLTRDDREYVGPIPRRRRTSDWTRHWSPR